MEQKALDTTSSTEKALLASTSTEPTPKKKRGPKGPNPLSVMKKKKPSNPPTVSAKAQDTSKEKGKEKSMETVIKDGETNKMDAERSTVTGKRKRPEEDEISTKGQRSADPEGTDIVANGTSRKRRRKRKASDSLSIPT